LGKEKLIKKNGSPRLVLKFHCGCSKHKFETLEAAWEHLFPDSLASRFNFHAVMVSPQ
jgi:hypothetical protein